MISFEVNRCKNYRCPGLKSKIPSILLDLALYPVVSTICRSLQILSCTTIRIQYNVSFVGAIRKYFVFETITMPLIYCQHYNTTVYAE